LLPANIANRIPNHDRITVRHLLNHSSGLFNYIDNERYEKETFSEGTLDNVIDWAFGKGSKPPAFAPGTGFEYSDTNTIVAELIVQQVTGNPLALEIRDRILTPLGLKNTYMVILLKCTFFLIKMWRRQLWGMEVMLIQQAS